MHRIAVDNRQLLVIEFVFALFAWAAIARVFVMPAVARLPAQTAVRFWIAPQMFRIVGLTLLADGITGPGLDPSFAAHVATGDALTAGLAVVTFIALRHRVGVYLAALTTLVGMADLVFNVARGMQIGAADHLGAGWFVVAFVVPLMFVAHVGAARCLIRGAFRRRT